MRIAPPRPDARSRSPQVVAHEIGVPVGSTRQPLEAVGCAIVRHLGQLPRVPTLGVGDKPCTDTQIIPRSLVHLGAGENVGRSARSTHPAPVHECTVLRSTVRDIMPFRCSSVAVNMLDHATIYNCSIGQYP
jgi:hypothetical protein